VVLAQAHNPTILHPTFLSVQGIVPADWQLADPPICTPAISVVKYVNQIVFTAELNKLMVLDNAPRESTPVPSLASKYVEMLPHVNYSAVGINVSGYVECPSPAGWVINRFLKRGSGNDDKLEPSAIGIKFVYPVERGILNLNCDVGSIEKTQEKSDRPCLLINGNYHISVSHDKALEETQSAIGLYPQCVAHFAQISQVVFGLES
jgi:hypothetical protein